VLLVLDAVARALLVNASMVISGVGLMAMTIPFPQCPVCMQKTHNGFVAFWIWILQLGKGPLPEAMAGEMNIKPELKPFARGEQGFAKELCVAVWFLEWNSKETISPAEAVTTFGLNVKVLLPPTTTV